VPLDGKVALSRADAVSLGDRAERYNWLNRDGSPVDGYLLTGGMEAFTCWWEAGTAYVHGLYIGTILLSQACLEHLLAGWLVFSEDDQTAPRLRYVELLKRARDGGVLTRAEYDLFDRLRRERNPVAHARHIDDPRNLLRRAMDTQVGPEQLLRNDAELALQSLKALLDRPPFALGPLEPTQTP
jgi:hypothetical protein